MNDEGEIAWRSITTSPHASEEILSKVVLACARICALRLIKGGAEQVRLEVLCSDDVAYRQLEASVHQAIADQLLREKIREKSGINEGEMLLRILSKTRNQ